MKTAAMVLGIVGGALAIIICLWTIGGLLIANSAVDQLGLNEVLEEAQVQLQGQDIPGFRGFSDSFLPGMYNLGMGIAWVFGILGLIGGIGGLIGGLLVKKNNVLAGVLMLVAGVLTFSGCITFVLLVLGGIFALVKGKDDTAPVVQ